MSKIDQYLDRMMKSENFLPSPGKSTIAIAMSGGVDSSVAAYLLKAAGYNVFGITAWLISGSGRCCDNGVIDAVKVCDQIGIEHHAVDLRKEFADGIITDFHESYARGETPIPCITCNNDMKWGALLQYSVEKLGASHLASGHYAKLVYKEETNSFDLHRPLESKKDQSYMLWGLNQAQLEKTSFPLADFNKKEIREIAELAELCVASKPESQDICFVSNGMTNSDYLLKILGEKKGPIVLTKENKILGYHKGSFNYTYGQRKGLGVSYKEPIYVTKIDPEENTVYVGTKEELLSQKALGRDSNIISQSHLQSGSFDALTQIRYNSEPTLAQISLSDENKLSVQFYEPTEAITPGQAMVFYEPDNACNVIGGAWIDAIS